jgi:hypothetical protein
MKRVRVLAAIALSIAVVASLAEAAEQATSARAGGKPAAGAGTAELSEGLKTFQKQLDAYLKLRSDLSRKLAPLSSTPSATELTSTQTDLAVALQAARKGARQGDLVNPAAAAHIIRIVTADFQRRSAAAERAELQEVPRAGRPTINRTYPADAALPTVPPLLLSDLPRLPDNLQYRFFGRHIVILDADVQIIIDYVPDALPPR